MSSETRRATPLYWRISALRLIFVLFVPLALFTKSAWSVEGPFMEVTENAGALLIIFAVLGRFWSILYSGGRKNLVIVQDGPYSICRHPLYLFSAMGIIGFGMMLGSFVLTAVIGVAMISLLALTARLEERNLDLTHSAEYQAYRKRVPMLWPKLSLYRTPERIEVDVAALRGNFRDATVFLALLPIAELLEAVKEHDILPFFWIW